MTMNSNVADKNANLKGGVANRNPVGKTFTAVSASRNGYKWKSSRAVESS